MSWKIFSGIEAEGKWTGRNALFIEGNAPYHTILENIVEYKCAILYFGAVYKKFELPSTVNYDIVNKLIKAGYCVTVDSLMSYDFMHFIKSELFNNPVSNCQAIIGCVHLSVVTSFSEVGSIYKDRVMFKLLDMENKKAVLFNLAVMQIPDKSLYEKDELIVEELIAEGA